MKKKGGDGEAEGKKRKGRKQSEAMAIVSFFFFFFCNDVLLRVKNHGFPGILDDARRCSRAVVRRGEGAFSRGRTSPGRKSQNSQNFRFF